jgi:hypothetical protein
MGKFDRRNSQKMKRKTAQKKKKERIKRRVAANKTPVKAPAKKTATKKTAEKALAPGAQADFSRAPEREGQTVGQRRRLLSRPARSAFPGFAPPRAEEATRALQRMTVVW